MAGDGISPPVSEIAQLIQTALTPAFLLSGVAALLNVFSSRLGRVADRVDLLSQRLVGAAPDELADLQRQLSYLRRRTHWLDAAVVLGAAGGAFTCFSALLLFLGSLREARLGAALFLAFGLALLSTIGAIAAFLGEMLISSRGLRVEVDTRRAESPEPDRPPPSR